MKLKAIAVNLIRSAVILGISALGLPFCDGDGTYFILCFSSVRQWSSAPIMMIQANKKSLSGKPPEKLKSDKSVSAILSLLL